MRTIPVAITRRRRRAADEASGPADPAPRPTCLAPSTSLHLDQLGDVRPCCQSTYVLGNVEESSLQEIWGGERATALRAAVADGDLSLGCEFCAWAVRAGDDSAAYARRFDQDEVAPDLATPTRLEIAPSNTCNLQCTMCNGEWSSSIRSQREHLPPLPKRYGDAFFEQLEAWLPNLRQVDVFGGEPFLARESLRLLELLADRAPHVTGLVTTNGTIWNERVERLLGDLQLSVTVSVDGATQQTYESIRIGADWDVVTEHIARFQAACRASGTHFSLTHCLLVENWWELPAMLRWAADLQVPLYVNTVTDPPASSLHHLSAPELAHVVHELEAHDDEIAALGPPWSDLWVRELGRLRATLADRRSRGTAVEALGWDVPLDGPPTALGAAERWAVADRTHVQLDRHLKVVASDAPPDRARTLHGVHAGSVSGLVGRRLRWSAEGRAWVEVLRLDEGEPRLERCALEEQVPLRGYELWQAPLPSEAALRAEAERLGAPGAAVVELEVDADGVLAGVVVGAGRPPAGLEAQPGRPCQDPVDLFAPEVLDPAPTLDETLVDPVTSRLTVRWPGGRTLAVVVRSRHVGRQAAGSKVFLVEAPTTPAPSDRA